MQIREIKVCDPIATLVRELKKMGFETVEQKVNDYHFHEVYIKMLGNVDEKLNKLKIDKISRDDNNNFSCTCHWSIVEVFEKKIGL